MIEGVKGLALASKVTSPAQLAESYGSWDGIRTNHVVSSTGSFFDNSGSSRGLSTPEDLALLLELRKRSDLIIVDAATARNEGYRKLSSSHLAIVSSTGNFESIPAGTSVTGVTLFSPPARGIEKNLGPELVPISPEDPFEAIERWSLSMGYTSLLLEAGPTLTKICFTSNRVVQSAITITPRVEHEALSPNSNPFSSNGELLSVAQSKDATFTLWSY